MSTVISPEDIRPHDLLRFTVVGRALDLTDQSAVREQTTVELLHRPKPKPIPYDGILTGKQVKATPWKRWTRLMLIRNSPSSPSLGIDNEICPPGSIYRLDEHAEWVHPALPHFRFSDILDDDLFVLIYRPEEESDR